MTPHRPTTSIHIAVLDTDVPVPNVYAARGLYSSQFRVLLQAAAARLNARRSGAKLDIRTTAYDVVGGCLPPLERLRRGPRAEDGDGDGDRDRPIDALLITGSSAAAYALDRYPWIAPLQGFIQTVYDGYPAVRIFGSCFGHQIVAQALLSRQNPRFAGSSSSSSSSSCSISGGGGYVSVAACPQGYEIGIEPITLDPAFTVSFPELRTRLARPDGKLRLQLIHGDRVMPLSLSSQDDPSSASPGLPLPWLNVGSTAKSPIQGLYRPSRVLTLQGHFEFDAFVARETCREFARRGGWSDADVAAALERIGSSRGSGDDDAKVVAEMVVLFVAGEDGGVRLVPGSGSGSGSGSNGVKDVKDGSS
ncbi:hypothetical protein VTN02DRAFT_296 [Thermoascus thermophilus]